MSLRVPGNIKTSRVLPRLVAVGIVACWVTLMMFALGALKEEELANESAIDGLFLEGENIWGAQFKDHSGKCSAYLVSNFINQEKNRDKTPTNATPDTPLKLELKGALRFLVFGQAAIAKMHLEAGFDSLRKLNYILGRFRTTTTTITIESKNDATELIVEMLSAEKRERTQSGTASYSTSDDPSTVEAPTSLKLPFPGPIYLYQDIENNFRVRLPEGVSISQALTSLGGEGKVNIFKLDRARFIECKRQVIEGDGITKDALIDIGRYLAPFGSVEK